MTEPVNGLSRVLYTAGAVTEGGRAGHGRTCPGPGAASSTRTATPASASRVAAPQPGADDDHGQLTSRCANPCRSPG